MCDYPGIGRSGVEGPAYHYYCDFPIEINGTHWHCDYGGGMMQAQAGVSIMMFNASIQTPLGVLEGSCSWRCPDMTMGAAPNPPGAWKNHITPIKCEMIGPNTGSPAAA